MNKKKRNELFRFVFAVANAVKAIAIRSLPGGESSFRNLQTASLPLWNFRNASGLELHAR